MSIRAVAIGLIEKGDHIFVAEYRDADTDEAYYRPLGGGIEFGELAKDTLIREFSEEMSTDIEVIGYLHTFENIFTFDGKPAHQIMMLFAARFKDESIYQVDKVICDEEGQVFEAKWIDRNDFFRGYKTLYPSGLSGYLQAIGGQS